MPVVALVSSNPLKIVKMLTILNSALHVKMFSI